MGVEAVVKTQVLQEMLLPMLALQPVALVEVVALAKTQNKISVKTSFVLMLVLLINMPLVYHSRLSPVIPTTLAVMEFSAMVAEVVISGVEGPEELAITVMVNLTVVTIALV